MLRNSLVISMVCLGCARMDGPDLEGRWFGETLVNVDQEYLAAATAWVRGTSFEFTGSNATITIPTELPRTAPYEVVAQHEDQLTVAFHRPNGQRDMAQFILVQPHLMRWDIGDSRAVMLRRTE